ncbi:MAG: SRPBCC family protein [Nitrospiraceae bacterium]
MRASISRSLPAKVLSVVVGFVVSIMLLPAWAGQEFVSSLIVETDPGGGVHARAVLNIPSPRAVVEHVLTDYGRWPELFDTKMRMGTIERTPGRDVVEMFIEHPILPGESRLLSENRREADGRLATSLLGGDFKRYARTWTLSETADGRVRAEFTLVMEAKTLAPDWIVAIALRRELDTHFKKLAARIARDSARRQ